MAEQLGFDVLYMTGYGAVGSALGLPDAGLASYTDMVGRVKMLTETVSAPLVADGDTGYGGLLNVAHTVKATSAPAPLRSRSRIRNTPRNAAIRRTMGDRHP